MVVETSSVCLCCFHDAFGIKYQKSEAGVAVCADGSKLLPFHINRFLQTRCCFCKSFVQSIVRPFFLVDDGQGTNQSIRLSALSEVGMKCFFEYLEEGSRVLQGWLQRHVSKKRGESERKLGTACRRI